LLFGHLLDVGFRPQKEVRRPKNRPIVRTDRRKKGEGRWQVKSPAEEKGFGGEGRVGKIGCIVL
jgi:hypothetical protein